MRRITVFALAVAAAVPLSAAAGASPAAVRALAGGHHVLLVGSFHGVAGTYTSVQAAVDAAQPGDWILVGPGDHHESGTPSAGVMVTTPGIHIRGMDRNQTVIDGTMPGSAACSGAAADQAASADGRNGVEVFEVDGVTVENLTVCNYLGLGGDNGNEVWWNGGDGSGQIGMGRWGGAYLTASSSYFAATDPAMAMYGVFISNADGPGMLQQAYASNMADSSFYVGACRDCNAVLRNLHAENSALGYSGSNSGGHLVIESSEWNGNRAGIVPNSLANDDPPSPQDGSCPNVPTTSCTLIQGNWVHDNNNPNTPALGLTATVPVGTGIEVSGGRSDTVRNNTVEHQGGWGILVNDFPDTSPPSVPTYCAGGIPDVPTAIGTACYFVAFGNRVVGNTLSDNGGFGNPSNGDLADATIAWPVDNCFTGNHDSAGLTSDPASIQSPSVLGRCGVPGEGDTGMLFAQLTCAAFDLCPAGGTYPQPTGVEMLPIPDDLPTMPDPCAGVPENPWCTQ